MAKLPRVNLPNIRQHVPQYFIKRAVQVKVR